MNNPNKAIFSSFLSNDCQTCHYHHEQIQLSQLLASNKIQGIYDDQQKLGLKTIHGKVLVLAIREHERSEVV